MMRKLSVVMAVLLVIIVGAIIIVTHCRNGRPTGLELPEGNYVADEGKEWMIVSNGIVRIGRERSSFSVLLNKTNEKLFDKNDISYVHPQYLRYIDKDMVEWVREASGPSPQYKIKFHRK